MKTVRIFLEGGVIQDIQVPKGVQVEVCDYDQDELDDFRIEPLEGRLLRKDFNGDEYIETIWGPTFTDQEIEDQRP